MVTPLDVKRVETELVFQTPDPQLFRDLSKGSGTVQTRAKIPIRTSHSTDRDHFQLMFSPKLLREIGLSEIIQK